MSTTEPTSTATADRWSEPGRDETPGDTHIGRPAAQIETHAAPLAIPAEGSACGMQLLLWGERASHEDVVDVAAVKKELCLKDALDDEATGFVQQPGAGVGTQDAEA